MQLPTLRRPPSLVPRARRRLWRDAQSLGRRIRNRDYRTIRWLAERYAGPTEVTRAFFINLDSSPDRRADMERGLLAVGAPFERFRGVDGAQERDAYREYLAQRPPLPPSRRPWGELVPYEVTDGMIGCWLSHVHLLGHIATLEEGLYLVLEDDYRLPSDWRRQLQRVLAEIPDDWDILKLYSRALNGKPRLRGARISDHLVRLGPALLSQQNLSSAAYVVRHHGSRVVDIKQLFESAPVAHYDDAMNYLMDDIRIYAPRKQFGSLTDLSIITTR
jgi:GR25 family glycosyltransferase involved in LPS biosynthesis